MDTKEQILKILEVNSTISNRGISEILKISRSSVQYYLRILNIHRDRKTQQKLNNTSREKRVEISPRMEQIILGSILGDGTISKYKRPKNTKQLLNSQLTCGHGIKQKNYIEYKKALIEAESIKCYLHFIDPSKMKKHYIKDKLVHEQGIYQLRTMRNVSFNKYRDMFYKEKKFANKYIYKLNALGLAIWYMDDGTRYKNTYRLCTNNFSLKDLYLLQKMLKHNFSIDTTLQKTSNIGYYIYIRTKSVPYFIKLVSPYIHESMKYKIVT